MKEKIELDEILEEEQDDFANLDLYGQTNITIVGVGGCGNNMITHLFDNGVDPSVKLIAANTDIMHLAKQVPIDNKQKIVLGANTTKGRGAGCDPKAAKSAADESYSKIKSRLDKSDLVIICAGLGGGTGSGASPVIAKIAKELEALTICVVTKPFKYEGSSKAQIANEALKELRESCDSLVVIPNDRLSGQINKNTSSKDARAIVDSVLFRAVNGLSDIVTKTGVINVDFADVRAIMGFKGLALLGIGHAKGEESAQKAVAEARDHPLLNDISINGAKGILINVETNPNYPMNEISKAQEELESHSSRGATVKVGLMYNDDMEDDEIRITLIATGFEQEVINNTINQDEPENRLFREPIDVKKVSNGTNQLNMPADLDIPSYIRHKKD
ncbi:MAG: cell division protein FtsZ [Helicobacter sp.]|nr:cell division protein FtsZ [Helicobacter sp.]